jgi:hypothetical protein
VKNPTSFKERHVILDPSAFEIRRVFVFEEPRHLEALEPFKAAALEQVRALRRVGVNGTRQTPKPIADIFDELHAPALIELVLLGELAKLVCALSHLLVDAGAFRWVIHEVDFAEDGVRAHGSLEGIQQLLGTFKPFDVEMPVVAFPERRQVIGNVVGDPDPQAVVRP